MDVDGIQSLVSKEVPLPKTSKWQRSSGEEHECNSTRGVLLGRSSSGSHGNPRRHPQQLVIGHVVVGRRHVLEHMMMMMMMMMKTLTWVVLQRCNNRLAAAAGDVESLGICAAQPGFNEIVIKN